MVLYAGWQASGAEAGEYLELPELRGIETSPEELRIGAGMHLYRSA